MRSLYSLFIVFSLLALCPQNLFSQEFEEQDTVNNGIILLKEKAFGVSLHTLGYGISYRTGVNKSFFKRRIFEFDLLEMKAPNQEKTYNDNFLNPKYYYYGKLNNLYILRAGIGQQKLLNRKPYWGGIEVRYFYSGGVSLGLAKPVYLHISYYGSDFVIFDTKTEKFDPSLNYPVTTPDYTFDIYGRAPVFTGFKEIKPYPGVYVKGGFSFDYASSNDRVKTLEIGLIVDGYPKGVPVMAFRDPFQVFLTGYFSFYFGKRYN